MHKTLAAGAVFNNIMLYYIVSYFINKISLYFTVSMSANMANSAIHPLGVDK